MFTTQCHWKTTILWLLLVGATCLSACTGNLVYTGQPDRVALAELPGRRIALLRFDYNAGLLTGDKALTVATAQPLAAFHKAQLLARWGEIFTMIDTTEQAPVDDPAALAAALTALEADAGLLVTTVYGYRLAQGVAEQIGSQLSEKLDPENQVQDLPFLNDPTAVEFYYLAADTRLVGQDGQVIWNFYGKASQTPQPFSQGAAQAIATLWNRFAGLEPDEQEMVTLVGPAAAFYEAYQVWLLRQEIAGQSATHYFKDYPAADKTLGIYPASDSVHVPFVAASPEAAVAAAPVAPTWYESLWHTVNQADWRQFGQWPVVWAALKLFLVTFVIGAGLALLYQWAGEESCLGKLVAVPALVASFAWLVAIWFLLKALL